MVRDHLPVFREGDFLETRDNLIFDVKGLLHPHNRVIAFLRYYPSEDGERKREGVRYRKVYSLDERFSVLKDKFPSYVYFDKVYDSIMQGVPVNDVARLYQPTEKLTEMSSNRATLDKFERDSLEFCEILSGCASVNINRLGLSGSILVGLHNLKSDIDIIVYGSESCLAVYGALNNLYSNADSSVRPYNDAELKKLFSFRSADTVTRWESFLRTERRKRLQGKFKNYEYFLRFIKDWKELKLNYGDLTYRSLGKVTIKAEVADDSEALFTPCIYKIKNAEIVEEQEARELIIDEIASFRGRFCEVARNEEPISARGKLELVIDKSGNTHHRVIVGGEKDDFLTLS